MQIALLLATLTVLAAQAQPPRDKPATQTGATATVRGRITAAATGEPLHRVRVTLNTSNPNPPSGVTDTRGDFEITGVPAGSYSLTAVRAGYLTIQYGQRRPREAGRTIEVKAGEIIDGIQMALPRGSVLAGAISDETGDPFAGARVEAVEFRYLRGRRVPVQAASTTTNDLGQYRLSDLPPGPYFLRATSTETWQDDEGKNAFVYAVTYFPGVTGADQAQTVNVNVGQQVVNLSFSLRPGRAARITGVLQDAAGTPLAAQAVTLSRIIRGVAGAPFASGSAGSTRTDASGSFAFPDLPPDEYTVNAGGQVDRISESVIVADGDVRHVVLSPSRGSSLAGTIVTADGTPLPFPANRLRIVPVAADAESMFAAFAGPRETAAGRDATFRFAEISGPWLFRLAGLPDDWMLSSVVLDGRNMIDTPIEVLRGGIEIKGLQLVISQNGARLQGNVVAADGKPAPDSTVVLFAQDAGRWTLASRFIRASRPDDAGRFAMGGLPPGVYRIAAREFVADGQWEDPEFLTSLLGQSVRIELGERASETLTLKVEAQR